MKTLEKQRECDAIAVRAMHEGIHLLNPSFISDKTVLNEVFGNFDDYYKSHIKKIRGFAKRFNLSFDDAVNVLRKNDYLASVVLSQNPKKKNIYEKNSQESLEEICRDLNKEFDGNVKISVVNNNYGNENKWAISDDGEVKKYDEDIKNLGIKKFDFIINVQSPTRQFKIYTFNKTTNGSGGAQDEVFSELKLTSLYCEKNHWDQQIFFFILDGTYWDKRRKSLTDTDKCKYINEKNIKTYIKNLIKNI